MKIKYYTYDRLGVVTNHYFILFAFVKVLYQSWILGVDSHLDEVCTRDELEYYKTILTIKGFRPFKFLIKK